MLFTKMNRESDDFFQDKMSMTSSQNESDSGYRYSACFTGRRNVKYAMNAVSTQYTLEM